MLLTIKDVATRLQIKPSTLYAWAAQGKIPCLYLHGLVRFQREDIERWVESFRVHDSTVPLNTAPRGHRTAVDEIVAHAKQQAYNPASRGNQTEIKPHRKGGA